MTHRSATERFRERTRVTGGRPLGQLLRQSIGAPDIGSIDPADFSPTGVSISVDPDPGDIRVEISEEGAPERFAPETFGPDQEPEPNLTATAVRVSPSRPTVDEPAEVDVTVRNSGDAPGPASFDVLVDGEPVGVTNFFLQPGVTASQAVTWTPAQDGRLEVQAGGARTIVTVQPAPQPSLGVTELAVPPSPRVGEQVAIDVGVTNEGDAPGPASFDVLVDGEPVGATNFFLQPGVTASQAVTWTPQSAGRFVVTAGEQSTTVDVQQAPADDVQVESITPEVPPVIRVGEQTELVVRATNAGDAAGTEAFEVTADGTGIGSVRFTLDPGESGAGQVAWTPEAAGTVRITAGQAATNISVLPAEQQPPPEEPTTPSPDDRPEFLESELVVPAAIGAALFLALLAG